MIRLKHSQDALKEALKLWNLWQFLPPRIADDLWYFLIGTIYRKIIDSKIEQFEKMVSINCSKSKSFNSFNFINVHFYYMDTL